MRLTILHGVSLAILLVVGGCGGGGPRGPTPDTSVTPTTMPPDPQPTADILTGSFSPPIEGISFSSGSIEGITEANGGFLYEEGNIVTFSLGGIVFGELTGQELVTLIDLVGAGITDIRVQNINRLLFALDTDNDINNGIQISAAVQAIAENFPQPDFTIEDFDGEVATILSDVATADNRTPVLPSFAEAEEVLTLSLACLASGVYSGKFTGDDMGTFLLWVQHQRFDPGSFPPTGTGTGVTSALVFSTVDELVLGVAPIEGITPTPDRVVISGNVSSGAEFTGNFNSNYTSLSGIWANGFTSEAGTFIGERKAGNATAIHRLAGLANSNTNPFTADGSSLIGLDVMSDNSVSGILVTLRGNETILSGSLSNGVITVSGGDFSFNLDFDPDGSDPSNDLALGSVGGFLGVYTDGAGGGTTIGTSCRLN